MKTNFLFTLITVTTITTLQIYAMEDVVSQQMVKNGRQSALLSSQHNYQSISKDIHEKFSLVIAELKTRIKQNNPRLIKPLLKYAQKEAQTVSNAVHIELGNPAQHKIEKEYIQQGHVQKKGITPLLIEAIQQKNIEMINELSRKNTDTTVLNSYYAKTQETKIEKVIVTIACGIIIILGTVLGLTIIIDELTCHNKWSGSCSFPCNGTLTHIPADSCHPTGCNILCAGYPSPIPIPCGLNCRENYHIGVDQFNCLKNINNNWSDSLCFFYCNGTSMQIPADSCSPTGCNISCSRDPMPVPCGLNCRENYST